MTKTKKSEDTGSAKDSDITDRHVADRLSDLMVSVRTTQGSGAFTAEQEAAWMALDAELRGTAAPQAE